MQRKRVGETENGNRHGDGSGNRNRNKTRNWNGKGSRLGARRRESGSGRNRQETPLTSPKVSTSEELDPTEESSVGPRVTFVVLMEQRDKLTMEVLSKIMKRHEKKNEMKRKEK